MSAHLRWLDSPGSLNAEAYRQLWINHPLATPFQELAWLRAAAAALPPEAEVHLLLVESAAGELLGCLAFQLERETQAGLPLRVLRFLGHPLADRLCLLLTPACEALLPAIGAAILAHCQPDLIQLHELDARDTLATGWLAQWQKGICLREQRLICTPPEHLLCEDDREEVKGNVRYKLRRASKRCHAAGVSLNRYQPGADQWPALMARIAEVEAASWKGDQGVGVFSGEQRLAWMRNGLAGLADQGLLCVVTHELNGQIISYRLGFLTQGRLYDYNLAFLPAYGELGSGRLLLQAWFDWGLDAGWQVLDASRVSLESSHQLHERMTGQQRHERWSLYTMRWRGVAAAGLYRGWRWLKARKQAKRVAADSKASVSNGETA
ncbi:GNAT family N-acetyltransferase [Pokkaliibacter sp. CJK22405]|uniref:GNAT family N-acetyltransferase n=1 Tax=Pokkaliibacter sp. CJK22405 TaxID=3384615 RepID=UPI0039849BBB